MLKSINYRFAIGFLFLLLIVALSADFLANTNNGILVGFGPNSIGELNNTFEPPGFIDIIQDKERIHPLGTDGRGRDVASILIHGCRTSILLGFLASIISVIIGGFFGLVSGYYGDKTLNVHPISIFLATIGLTLITFYSIEWGWTIHSEKLSFSYFKTFSLFLFSSSLLVYLLSRLNSILKTSIYLPIDSIVMRFAEIFRAVPTLFILLTLITFIKIPNIWTTVLLLGALGWSRILRIVRGEVLEIKNKTFITNAQLLGMSDFKVISSHVLPNVLPLILVSMAFLISNNILLESTLSFLGIGIPLDVPSWGGLLRQSREDFSAWWLAIFPGLTITLTLFSLNIIAEQYNKSVKKKI